MKKDFLSILIKPNWQIRILLLYISTFLIFLFLFFFFFVARYSKRKIFFVVQGPFWAFGMTRNVTDNCETSCLQRFLEDIVAPSKLPSLSLSLSLSLSYYSLVLSLVLSGEIRRNSALRVLLSHVHCPIYMAVGKCF